jgi:type IV secretion system protein VirB4
MMNLAEYRRRSQRLADYLPWAALVQKGLILNKDGSFQRTARFRGPDLDSATPAELVAATARLNNALRRLGSGWAIFVEAQRQPAGPYPESAFPDPASRLVDAERRAQFDEEGAHFDSRYFLTSSSCRQLRMRRAPRGGSTRGERTMARTGARRSPASSTVRTAYLPSPRTCPH